MIQPFHGFIVRQASWWLSGKEFAFNSGTEGNMALIPESGRSPGEGRGNPLQYSCLENPMDRGAWWATIPVVTELDMTEWLSAHGPLLSGPARGHRDESYTVVPQRDHHSHKAPCLIQALWLGQRLQTPFQGTHVILYPRPPPTLCVSPKISQLHVPLYNCYLLS